MSLDDIKEELSFHEEEDSILLENKLKNQLRINVAYINETLASYLKKEVFNRFFISFFYCFFFRWSFARRISWKNMRFQGN